MEIGMVGLGKMGGAMVRALVDDGHDVVAFDLDEERVRAAEADGARGAGSLEEVPRALGPPRAIWIMVPHGDPTDETIDALLPLLDEGDVVVDGGNSRWSDSVDAAGRAAGHGVDFVDAGVSGGVWGLERGYCMMLGGSEEAFRRIEPAVRTLAPEDGYARVGGSGAGHFVKMVHNAVEYAMLQGIGEGFELLHRSDFDVDLGEVAELWQHGAVVQSWLLELAGRAFREEGNDLADVADWVDDSGMGRWSVDFAVERAVPAPAITAALFERFASRQDDRFSAKVVAALRNQFGGHAVREEDG